MTVKEDKGFILSKEENFYLREKEPEMFENAVDGVFEVSELAVPWSDDISKGNYINIIRFPRGTVYTFNEGITTFPSKIKLKLTGYGDNIYNWDCISQKFSSKDSIRFKFNDERVLLVLAIIMMVIDLVMIFVVGNMLRTLF